MVMAMMWKPDFAVFDAAAGRPPDASGRLRVRARSVGLFHQSSPAFVAARVVRDFLRPIHARFGDVPIEPHARLAHAGARRR
ncbi:hypothetical protein BLTE_15040 [Blastochloris tepida]|uniref:Uncharacterized protein n=1 Tax=Blastochloris tepida TaxID=2233851 RepID=A0A348FZT6_9HYPH|nr:hypothetical protein BLTE_15040 [Blastochloris tepida]